MRSLQWKLTLSYVLLTISTVLAVGIVSLYLFKSYTERQEEEYLKAIGEKLESRIRERFPNYAPDKPALQEFAEAARILGNIHIKIEDRENRILAESKAQIKVPSSPFFRLTGVINTGAKTGTNSTSGGTEQSAEPSDEQGVRIPIGGKHAPLGYIELSSVREQTAMAVGTARNAFLTAALGAGLLAVFISLLMGRRLTLPLKHLTAAVKSMGERNWGIRVDQTRSDEIGQLSRQFNLMADKIEAGYKELMRERDTLKRFIQDASHQLRTPLTALSTFNELLLEKSKDSSPKARNSNERYQDFLEDSKTQIQKLDWIIQNLLNLSRLESGMLHLNRENHDLLSLVESAWNGLKAKAESKDISFECSVEREKIINCDGERIEMVLSNILDNAVHYSGPGTVISLGYKEEKSFDIIWVQDQGPGILPEEQERVFDRFYRSPKSPGEGSGLGLSIVQGIINAHSGRIWVESKKGAGACFVIRLPRLGKKSKGRVKRTVI